MIINPKEYNEKGCYESNLTCPFEYEGPTRIFCSSIMLSKWGGGGYKPKAQFCSQGAGGSGKGLNLLCSCHSTYMTRGVEAKCLGEASK